MPPPTLLAAALRGRQRGQERQGPDAPRPWDWRQQHEAEPAQAACLDEVPVAGPHGITVDAYGRDAPAAPTLDGVVHAQHYRPGRHEGGNEQAEQQTRGRPWAPGGAVQHPVVVHEPPLTREACDPQDAGHGAMARCQDGTAQQHLGVTPTPLQEQGRKRQDERGKARWQVKHGSVFLRDTRA